MIVRDLLIKLGFRSDTGPLDKTEKKIAGMKGQVSALNVAAGSMLAGLAQQGIGKIADTLRDGVDQTVEFGREMANISSILGGDKMRTKELAADVERLSLTYGRSTTDIAVALYDLIGTLGDSKEATSQLELAMKLGRAGAASTKDGLRVLTAVTKAYGDTSMGTMMKVADLASNTVELGVITMPELASSIGIVTPLASTLGISIEEVMANTATLTGVTGTGSEVMHQFASAMRSVIDRSKPMEKAFQKAFGAEKMKSISEAIQKYGMIGTLQRLVATTDGSIESVNSLFGRIEGLNEALAITGKLSGAYIEKSQSMTTVAGKVTNQFEAQTTGLGAAGFAMDKAKAKSDAMSRQIGEKMLPAFLGLEEVSLTIKQLFIDYILPIFMGITENSKGATHNINALTTGFRILGATIATTIGFFDMLFSVAQAVATVLAGVAAAIGLIATRNFSAAGAALRQMGSDVGSIMSGFAARGNVYGSTIETAFADVPRMQTISAVGQSGGRLGGGAEVNTNVGGVTINVTAAPGTEAAAASRELDTVARAVWDQNLVQAQAAFAGDY